MAISFEAALRRVNEKQIRLAGPRYTPGIDPGAPNIEMGELLLAIGCLGLDERFRSHIEELRADLRKTVTNAPSWLKEDISRGKHSFAYVDEALLRASQATPRNIGAALGALARATTVLTRRLERRRTNAHAEEKAATNDEERRGINSKLVDIARAVGGVRSVDEFCVSQGGQLLTNQNLFLVGEWGTGKTHLLCDVVRMRDLAGIPSLLILGQHLPLGAEPLQAICDHTAIATSPHRLFQKLSAAGRARGCRSLLIVDGINEGDRDQWRLGMAALVELARNSPYVGVVVSCRRPFDEDIAPPRVVRRWTRIEHFGFREMEFDAQLEFFAYYEIPAPQTPLLTPEFSRPLFLKVICESIQRLSKNRKKVYLRDLASGQKGMTRVLEDFARHIGADIEADFSLPPKTCWRLLKGEIVEGERRGIAPVMADTLREHLTRAECLAEIKKITGLVSPKEPERFLQRLIVDGLLVAGLQWQEIGPPVDVIRLPYQRFSDHLIARHLLDRYLVTENEQTVRRSLHKNRPVGHVFSVDEWGHQYANPGVAEAIMLEFPERVKRVVPEGGRELFFFLPRDRQLVRPLKEVFLGGLAWRAPTSFNEQTALLVSFFLRRAGDYARDGTFETLVGLGTRPNHPYTANKLYAYLSKFSMAERDLHWSEFLRTCDTSSAAFRLIEWIERTGGGKTSADSARPCMLLLALFCSTTRRPVRDRATRAMVVLGEQHPKVLIETTLSTLSFNDPYVPERTLAACYGVAMRNHARRDRKAVREALIELGRRLIELMFLPGSPHATKHVLRRDFALGVIAVATKLDPGVVSASTAQFLRRPFRQIASPFPRPSHISEAKAESAKPAFRMDFENYTIGSLVEDRGNYNYDHPGYKSVRKQILWRIRNLGYSSAFEPVDRSIENSAGWGRGPEPGRTDRYGKKYSWIAYFEMYGWRADRNKLSKWQDERDRPSDVDIDPSFPPEAAQWRPPLPDLFAESPKEHRDWIENGPIPDYETMMYLDDIDGHSGPWILLEGFVQQASSDDRKVFTFIRGVLARVGREGKLASHYFRIEYPGNYTIPEPLDCYYTFAGEIPWSGRYLPALRTRNGTPKRDLRRAFHVWDKKNSGVIVEVPVCRFAWEGYHSTLNQAGGVLCLAPAVAENLTLTNRGDDWDLFDANGERATITRRHRDPDGSSSTLLYIRCDLLRRYLEDTGQVLVLMSWGERELSYERIEALREEIGDLLQRHNHIHRRAYLYRSSSPTSS